MSDACISRSPMPTATYSVAFDAGQLSSDSGLIWLAHADERVGVSAALTEQVPGGRRAPHSSVEGCTTSRSVVGVRRTSRVKPIAQTGVRSTSNAFPPPVARISRIQAQARGWQKEGAKRSGQADTTVHVRVVNCLCENTGKD